MRFLPLLLLPLLLGIDGCKSINVDTSATAAESNDLTIQFAGFGAVSRKGYLFVQLSEGSDLNGSVTLITPKLDCAGTACAKYQFFMKDGSFGHTAGIAKGATSTAIPLSWILGHAAPLTAGDEGEYSAVIQLFFTGPDGKEYSQLMDGFVRVNVLKNSYKAVGCNDPAIQWKLKTGDNCEAQFTTAGRSVACGAGCEQ